MRQVGNKISYVRNPFARRSFICLGLGILALGLGAFRGLDRGDQIQAPTAFPVSWLLRQDYGTGFFHLQRMAAIIFWPRSELPWKDLLSSSGS